MMDEPEQLKRAIERAGDTNAPAAFFREMPEHLVWTHAKTILEDREAGLGPVLIEGIGLSLAHLQQRVAARDVLQYALTHDDEGWVFHAAQRAVLSNASLWEVREAREFYNTFEDGYRTNIEGGDPFIALLALDGAVMLAIYRPESGLFHRAVALLVDEFPALPSDPGDDAPLPVRALKLLGRCYDRRPDERDIVVRVQAVKGHSNYAVDAEARFTLGIIRLYDAFQAGDEASFIASLDEAHLLFTDAAAYEEERTDAALFAAVTRCYIEIISAAPSEKVQDSVTRARELLFHRLMAFGGSAAMPSATDRAELEFRIVQLITHLEQWDKVLRTATMWPEIKPPMSVLTELYAAVRGYETTQNLMPGASVGTQSLVMLPTLRGRFATVQELMAKLTSIMADSTWRSIAPPSEVEFYQLAMRELQEVEGTPPPKAGAATGLHNLLMAAQHLAPELAEQVDALIARGVDTLQALSQLLLKRYETDRLVGPARDIYESIVPQLRAKLHWEVSSERWTFLRQALKIMIRYLIVVYNSNRRDMLPVDVNFLFAKESGGKGQAAVEADLEGHFRLTVSVNQWLRAIERQPQSVVPGIPDLLLRFTEDVQFTLEVKRELEDISHDNINARYVAQPQQYAAALLGVGFMFVLDLTPKSLDTSLPKVTEYCYLDYRPVPNSNEPMIVIVFVIPANRPLPSELSWGRSSTPQTSAGAKAKRRSKRAAPHTSTLETEGKS